MPPAGDGATRVVLERRGWEALGDEAEMIRSRYDQGWELVLGQRFAAAAESAAA